MTTEANRPLLALGIVALCTMMFAVSDVFSKSLVERHPVALVVAVRYASSLALLFIFVWPRVRSKLWRTTRPWMVMGRGVTLTLASLTMGLALRLMPVGETISILYLSPFAVMLIGIPILGERVSPLGWFLAVLGFCGVLLILRPGSGLDPMGVLWALINASLATLFHLQTRILSRSESSIAMLFYVTWIGALGSAAMALPNLPETMPDTMDLAQMALLGALATSGHFLFAVAYGLAPASIVAPAGYLHLVWAALLGLVVFGHVPAALTVLGMVLILGAGVANALHAQGAARKARAP